jgi:hypothetical protein
LHFADVVGAANPGHVTGGAASTSGEGDASALPPRSTGVPQAHEPTQANASAKRACRAGIRLGCQGFGPGSSARRMLRTSRVEGCDAMKRSASRSAAGRFPWAMSAWIRISVDSRAKEPPGYFAS